MNSHESANIQSLEGIEVSLNTTSSIDEEVMDDSEQEDTDEEEEEPKLKYARMTTHLGPIYRNGDATSAFMVAGDKMFIGTHDGNVHIALIPSFQFIRVYHAHSASISSISISPFPPPLPNPTPEGLSRFVSQALTKPTSVSSEVTTPRKNRAISFVPNTPSNAIYIATSSIDGNVCIQSLVDVKDVQLRGFGRPVQAVALSPEYKNDKTYISGGLAGNLVLTVGGKPGANSMSTTIGTATATASGWLGAMGLSGSTGKDTILHSGEGTISTIKWSLTGKYIVWINEHGVKIMRSNLHLDSVDSDFAWKRIGHIDRPDDHSWGEMASAWKGRVEWIDPNSLRAEEEEKNHENNLPSSSKTFSQKSQIIKKDERLLVGWGGTIWIIDIHSGSAGGGAKHRSVGRPEIVKILHMDCVISGLSLFSTSILLVLGYIRPEVDKEPLENNNQEQTSNDSSNSIINKHRGGIRRCLKALRPELRLIDINSSEEIDTDTLTVSRYEMLSASDYHLSILPAVSDLPNSVSPRGTFETLTGVGSGMWNATVQATSLLNSSASIKSVGSKGSGSTKQSIATSTTFDLLKSHRALQTQISKPGMKIFIHSPYDCILATKRDLFDHLSWLTDHEKYQDAWMLIDEHPEIITSAEKLPEVGVQALETPQASNDDFYDGDSTACSRSKIKNSPVEKEKYRIGELWIKQVMKKNDWTTAGKVCSKVLKTAQQWENHVNNFVCASKFDEIADHLPVDLLLPPLKSEIYEVILGHYIARNRPKAKELLARWPTNLYNIKNITTLLENQLKYRDVREDSVEDGEIGRDWRIVMESLGKLYVTDGHPRDSLKCYIELQDADTAMNLIRDHHLVDAIAEDIAGVILLRVSKQQIETASIAELKEATSETISLLVNEAHTGLISPQLVVQQLQKREMTLYLFFYVSALWRGDGIEEYQGDTREKLLQDSKTLVDQFPDLVVHLFAIYDRELLMEFLKSSTSYTLEKATQECELREYIPELVYLYSKTGQTKRALFLVIDRLSDVSQAISFAKEQNDSDLWEDLLNYSMDKPSFIRGLLEEVGTAINPITLIRRIPEGLEIKGLREGLKRILKEHEIQYSISYGVAKVLRGEVATAQKFLRSGQQKGVKFDIMRKVKNHNDVDTSDIRVNNTNDSMSAASDCFIKKDLEYLRPEPGHCAGCYKPFSDQEVEILVGFACGHVWHLSHLLSSQDLDQPVSPPEVEMNKNDKWAITHSVGVKVTHARLLKDKIHTGCSICNKNST